MTIRLVVKVHTRDPESIENISCSMISKASEEIEIVCTLRRVYQSFVVTLLSTVEQNDLKISKPTVRVLLRLF